MVRSDSVRLIFCGPMHGTDTCTLAVAAVKEHPAEQTLKREQDLDSIDYSDLVSYRLGKRLGMALSIGV